VVLVGRVRVEDVEDEIGLVPRVRATRFRAAAAGGDEDEAEDGRGRAVACDAGKNHLRIPPASSLQHIVRHLPERHFFGEFGRFLPTRKTGSWPRTIHVGSTRLRPSALVGPSARPLGETSVALPFGPSARPLGETSAASPFGLSARPLGETSVALPFGPSARP